MFTSVLSDARYALRWLGKTPGFTLVAVASLAVGIGFNTALFAVVDALLFRPLPVAEPARLVDVFTSSQAVVYGTTSVPDYLDLRAQNGIFEDIIGYSPMFAALSTGVGARLAMGEIVTGNYFRVLGVPALIGRTLLPEDDSPGAPRVVMVSYRYWSRELESSPDALGRTISIRGNPLKIIGVAPPGFTGMVPALAPEVWIPVASSLEVEPVGWHDVVPSPTGTTRNERRGDRWMFLRGRLKAGASVDQARANLAVVMSRLVASYPATNKYRGTAVKATSDVRFHPSLDPQIVPIARALMLVAALVLVVACLNVAGMLLARASSRQREIGVRLAIGASRWRVVRQLMTESIVLSMFGAIAGTLLARWIVAIVGSLSLPTPLPLALNLRIDGRVLGFTLVVTAVAALIAGLAPGLQTSKTDVTADLRGGQTGARAAGGRFTIRDALVAFQIAATVILLVSAALLTRSLIAEESAGLGFPVSRLALIAIDASQLGYTRDTSAQFFETALARVRTIPGVQAAAITSRPVFSLNSNRWDVWIPGRHQIGQPGDVVEVTSVSPDYFKTMDVPILSGRGFTDADGPDTPRVAIVNEAMAKKLWPGQDAIGQTFRSRGGDGPLFQVIGIAADHKVTAIGEPPTPFLHLARRQQPNVYGAVIARTQGDARTLLREMGRQLHAIGPELAFFENQTMESEVDATLFPVRVSAWLVGSVGATAMLLAAVGLYGVIAYSVARRTREIGIRIALGARRSTVLGLIMRQGLFVALAGLTAGSLLTAIAVRQFAHFLYRIGPGDPVSWSAAALMILVVSALANLLPASRAARVHPSEALRID